MANENAGSHKTFLFDLERIILAARISSNAKLVGFAMKTHANLDGTSVRVSTERLMVETGLSRSSVIRGRKELARVSLATLTRRGNRVKGRADEYAMTLLEDLDERMTWLSPHEMKAATMKLVDERQAAERARLQKVATEPPSEPPSADEPAAPAQVSQGHLSPGSGVTGTPIQVSHRHPTIPSDQSQTTATISGVGNATHHPRASDLEPDPHPGENEPTLAAVPKPPGRPRSTATSPGRGRQLPLIAAVTPEPPPAEPATNPEEDAMRPHLRELLDRPADRPTIPTATGPICTHCEVVLDPDGRCRNPICHPAATPTPTRGTASAGDECGCGALLDPDRVCRNPFHQRSTG